MAHVKKPPHRRESKYITQILHPPRNNKGIFSSYSNRVRWWLALRVTALAHELAHINDAQRGRRFNRKSVPHDQRIQEIRAEEDEQLAIIYLFTTFKYRRRFDKLAGRIARMTDPHWQNPLPSKSRLIKR